MSDENIFELVTSTGSSYMIGTVLPDGSIQTFPQYIPPTPIGEWKIRTPYPTTPEEQELIAIDVTPPNTIKTEKPISPVNIENLNIQIDQSTTTVNAIYSKIEKEIKNYTDFPQKQEVLKEVQELHQAKDGTTFDKILKMIVKIIPWGLNIALGVLFKMLITSLFNN